MHDEDRLTHCQSVLSWEWEVAGLEASSTHFAAATAAVVSAAAAAGGPRGLAVTTE